MIVQKSKLKKIKTTVGGLTGGSSQVSEDTPIDYSLDRARIEQKPEGMESPLTALPLARRWVGIGAMRPTGSTAGSSTDVYRTSLLKNCFRGGGGFLPVSKEKSRIMFFTLGGSSHTLDRCYSVLTEFLRQPNAPPTPCRRKAVHGDLILPGFGLKRARVSEVFECCALWVC